MDQTTSDLLNGRYQLEEQLGSGQLGEIYRAIDYRLGRVVAVRLVIDSVIEPLADWLPKLSQLIDPHIATLIDHNLAHDPPYFVTDYAPSLLLEAELSINEIIEYGREIAQALAYLHQEGFVHGGLHGNNVLLRSTGVMLTDSDWLNSAESSSDIYALGVLLYYLLTDQLPSRNPAPPSHMQMRQHVPGQLDALIVKMLSPHASERPSAHEIVVRLRTLYAYLQSRVENRADERDKFQRRVIVMREGVVLDRVPINDEIFTIGADGTNTVVWKRAGFLQNKCVSKSRRLVGKCLI